MGHLAEIARIVEALTNKDVWDTAGKVFGPLCVVAHLAWQRLRGRRASDAEDAALDERFMQNAVLDHVSQEGEIEALARERDYFQARWKEEQQQCAYERERQEAARAALRDEEDKAEKQAAVLAGRDAFWGEYSLTFDEGAALFRVLYTRFHGP